MIKNNYMHTYPTFIFFGTGHFAEHVLQTLIAQNHLPTFVISSPDKPVGRHQIMTAPAAKIVAQKAGIQVFQPEKLRTPEALAELKTLIDQVDVCVVADYGKILPQALLDLCPKGFLNIHPSLLPLHRGPAPLQATILSGDNKTGVTIIKIDADMDHGPIVAVQQVEIPLETWPCTTSELSAQMADIGARLLINTLPAYVAGNAKLVPQDHDVATYTKMIDKKDAEVSYDYIQKCILADIYLKYCAYKDWPEVFFIKDGKRVKIKKMSYTNGIYKIERVVFEGKSEVDWK
jgi:methionyl-tRNA formyltransferase